MALRPFGDALGLPARFVDRVENRHHPLEVGLARRSQLDLPCGPDKECDRELAFELADLLR